MWFHRAFCGVVRDAGSFKKFSIEQSDPRIRSKFEEFLKTSSCSTGCADRIARSKKLGSGIEKAFFQWKAHFCLRSETGFFNPRIRLRKNGPKPPPPKNKKRPNIWRKKKLHWLRGGQGHIEHVCNISGPIFSQKRRELPTMKYQKYC